MKFKSKAIQSFKFNLSSLITWTISARTATLIMVRLLSCSNNVCGLMLSTLWQWHIYWWPLVPCELTAIAVDPTTAGLMLSYRGGETLLLKTLEFYRRYMLRLYLQWLLVLLQPDWHVLQQLCIILIVPWLGVCVLNRSLQSIAVAKRLTRFKYGC